MVPIPQERGLQEWFGKRDHLRMIVDVHWEETGITAGEERKWVVQEAKANI